MTLPKTDVPLQEMLARFFEKVQFTDSCWFWLGAKNNQGYGHLSSAPGRLTVAHRWLYQTLCGEIPDKVTLDHLCNNVACVNPAHLDPCSLHENQLRAAARRKTCKKGHPWTPENTYIHKNGKQKGVRRCRTCMVLGRKRR